MPGINPWLDHHQSLDLHCRQTLIHNTKIFSNLPTVTLNKLNVQNHHWHNCFVQDDVEWHSIFHIWWSQYLLANTNLGIWRFAYVVRKGWQREHECCSTHQDQNQQCTEKPKWLTQTAQHTTTVRWCNDVSNSQSTETRNKKNSKGSIELTLLWPFSICQHPRHPCPRKGRWKFLQWKTWLQMHACHPK